EMPCPVAELDPIGGVTLCIEADDLSLWTATSPPVRLWSRPFPVRVARLVDGGVVAASADVILVLDRQGERLFEAPALNDPSRRGGAVGARVLIEGGGTSQIVDLVHSTVSPVTPCGTGRHSSLVLDPDPSAAEPVVVALCMDGTLRGPGVEGGLAQSPLIAPEREGIRMTRLRSGLLVVGTNKGELVLLDGGARVVGHATVVEGFVRILESSPDQRFVAVAGEGETVQIVSVPELARVASLPRRATQMSWDPAHPRELLTTGRWLERWRLAGPEADVNRPVVGAYRIPLEDGVVSLDVDPAQDDRIAVGFGGRAAVLTPDAMVARPLGFITTKAVSFVDDAVFAAGARGFLRLDAADLSLRATLTPWSIRRLVTLRDGTSIIGLYSGARRMKGGELWVQEASAVRDLSVSPGRSFAVMLREVDRALLRVRAGSLESELVGHDPEAEAVAVSADGERFFGARRGGVAEWDEGGLVLTYEAGVLELVDVEVSGDGQWVAAGARDGTVFLWRRGEAMPRARFMDHLERVPAMVFSRDSRWLVTGSWDRTLRVRDLAAVTEDAGVLKAGLERDLGLGLGEALGSER
ncbi:MAG: hypothetical protein JNJ59_16215, partial [Deltaproteobacteria bacterium]|nr:hypothetical protein [Deltaproteobacteria bacterium]